MNEEVLLRCKPSDDRLVNEFVRRMKYYAVIRTAHVGNFASSCKSSLAVVASVVSDPTVWAVTVNAERNKAAMVGKCIMNVGRGLRYRARQPRLQYCAGRMSERNQPAGVCLGPVYVGECHSRQACASSQVEARRIDGQMRRVSTFLPITARASPFLRYASWCDVFSSSVCGSSMRNVEHSVN